MSKKPFKVIAPRLIIRKRDEAGVNRFKEAPVGTILELTEAEAIAYKHKVGPVDAVAYGEKVDTIKKQQEEIKRLTEELEAARKVAPPKPETKATKPADKG